MTTLLIIGGICGYIFVAGIAAAVMDAMDMDVEDNWVFAAAWPVSLVMLAGYVVFMIPFGIAKGVGVGVDAISDHRAKKARKAREEERKAVDAANRVALETLRLERELGIGGKS